MEPLLIYLLTGVVAAAAGVLGGLLGVGGGIIVVPTLAFAYHLLAFSPDIAMHMAVATSLTTICFTSVASIRAHHRRGAVKWEIVRRFTPGIVLGAWLGAAIAEQLSGEALRVCFGVFALLVGTQLLLGREPKAHQMLPGSAGQFAAGGVIGSVSSLVGIGGGSLTVPYLVWCNTPIRFAVATSSACGLPIALAGTVGFIVAGWNHPALPPLSSGYVYWPAAIGMGAISLFSAGLGAKIAHTISPLLLKRIFALLLLAVGGRMVMI